MKAIDCKFYNENLEFLPHNAFKLIDKNLNWGGPGPLVVNINIIVNYSCTQKSYNKLTLNK